MHTAVDALLSMDSCAECMGKGWDAGKAAASGPGRVDDMVRREGCVCTKIKGLGFRVGHCAMVRREGCVCLKT